jgi:hypothetical protein
MLSALLSNRIAIARTQGKRMMHSAPDRDEIIAVVNRIGLMADRRDWQACREAFSDRVETDYTSLNGGQPAIVNADDLVSGCIRSSPTPSKPLNI